MLHLCNVHMGCYTVIPYKILIYSILFLAVQTEDLAGVMRSLRDLDNRFEFEINEKK